MISVAVSNPWFFLNNPENSDLQKRYLNSGHREWFVSYRNENKHRLLLKEYIA